MNKNEILKIIGTEYKNMTKRLLTEADLASHIPDRNTRIGIKPNLVSPTPASFGATTHPEIVAGIIEYLQENGFHSLTILEGSWVGDRTEEAYEICGYQTLSEQYGVPFFDTQKDSFVRKDCAGMPLDICSCIDAIDFLINVPVLKGHCQTKMTCALKNMKGLIPNSEKRRFHSMGLHKPIAHLNTAIKQDFIVIDHICGDPDCEDGGNPLVTNCIMAALDPVLADAYACQVLQYHTSDVPYVGMAEALGCGSTDLSTATIRSADENGNFTEHNASDQADEPGKDLPLMRQFVNLYEMIDEVESCSACYANLIPALKRLEEDGLLHKLSGKICIGQGFRGKTGKLGCGNCTADFDRFIPGCPPEEDDIYDFLRHYLTTLTH
jgi:uncharacterized protein (DUF362 family)